MEEKKKFKIVKVKSMRAECFSFNQDDLFNYGLNVNDSYVLRWFVDFTHSSEMEKRVCGEEMYYWVNYEWVITQLPLLRVTSAKSIQRIFNKLEECGVLKQMIFKEKKNPQNGKIQKGKWTYFAFDKGYDQLTLRKNGERVLLVPIREEARPETSGQKCPAVDKTPISVDNSTSGQKCPEHLDKSVHDIWTNLSGTSGQNCPIKDNNIKDNNIINNNIIDNPIPMELPPHKETKKYLKENQLSIDDVETKLYELEEEQEEIEIEADLLKQILSRSKGYKFDSIE